ncbi:MAG: class I SAM-dependent methyltransferase, partial [Caldilineae bacterium]
MESIQTLSNQYTLGHSQPELERLVHQGRFLGELTEIMLLKAGLAPGMRVLDVGCGAGDVSFLAAKLVGPEGAVIGVDRAPEAIAFAHQRAQSAGLTNVQFIAADLADFQLDGEPVDALVGRLVLMYFPDPAAVLRRLLTFVKPGGIVAFQELDTPAPPPAAVMCDPICETYVTAGTRINQALSRIGADTRVGSKLRRIFEQAGLPGAQTLAMLRYENGPDSAIYAWIEQLTR